MSFYEYPQLILDSFNQGLDIASGYKAGAFGIVERLNYLTENAHAQAQIAEDSGGLYAPEFYPVSAPAQAAPASQDGPARGLAVLALAIFGVAILVED